MRLSTAQQTPEVAVRGWDGTIKGRFAAGPRQTIPLDGTFSHRTGDWGPSDWAVFNGSAWEKVDNSDLPTGRFATLDNCGNLMDSGRVICPTEDSGGGKPPRLVIDPEGNTFTYVLNSVGDLIHAEGKGRQSGAVIFADYDYSELGQLRYITNTPDSNGYRRVDAAGYYTNGPQNGYLREWTVDTQGPTLTTAYEYDSLGNVTRLITPRGTDWIFIRNTEGRCVRSQTPTNLTARCSTDYFYDAADNLVQTVRDVLDQNDSKLGTMLCVMAHDELDRCVSQATQVSIKHFITNRFVYDANGNLTASLSPEAANGHDPDNLAAFSYDERNLLFRKTQGPAGTGGIRYEYSYSLDCRARRLIVTDSTGLSSQPRVSTFGHDGFDRCVNVTDAMGNVTTRAYGALNELVYQRLDGETNDVPGGALNRRLAEIRYEYDFLSRPTHIHSGFFDPVTGLSLSDGESTVSFTYAPNSACISSTDDNGHTTSFGYDTVGRLTTITDAKANATTCAYDADGNVLSVSSVERADLGGAAEEFSRTFSYDALDRCVRWSDNVTNTVQYAYDSFGNCVRSLDARGHLSGASFDYAGRCTLAVADLDLDGALDFAADAGRTFTWDDNSRLIAVTDDNTNTTTSTYDSLNRWTLIQRPQGSTARRGYNTADNIETNIDANGTMVVASFDALDRCVRRDITPASGVIGSTTFETFAYNGQSRCVAASNDLSFVRFDFDSLGDCVRSTQDGLATACSFDGSGNCLSMTYPSRQLVIYTYDGLDQVSTIATAPFGQVPATLATWAYEGPHRVGRITRGNTVNTRITWDGFLNPANASGDFGWRQVSGVNHQIAGGGAIIDRRGCAYDQNQNKILRAQLSPFFAGGSLATNQFGYDSLDRLRLAINSKGASVKRNDYILDGNGNRQVVTNSGVPQLYSMDATIPPGDFQADQYTTTPFGSQQYDANGNLVFRSSAAGAFQYKYDYADRLVEVDSFATGTAQPVVSFSYDAIGRRISKTDYPPAPAAPVTTQFIYDGRDTDSDGDGILEERVSGIVSRVFCWGRNDRYQEGGDNESVRCPIAIINPSGQPLYTHADELGNALALTDATGHVLERYDYDDYGFPTFLSADGSPLVDGGGLPVTASPQGNPFLFHSMFWDEESGLYCSSRREPSLGVAFECKQAMFVDPATGRRTSRSRSADGLMFNVVNPRAARLSQGSGCASSDCLGQSDLSFSGDNPWSARTIYTEWAAGPRHYDDLRISDCDDHDPKRHHPSACRTTLGFGVIVVTGDGADLCAFQKGDRPTQAQFATLIDSMVNRSDDRRLIGLRQYDPGLVYSPGDTTIYNSSLYKPKAKPITFPKTITGHVTLIK
jgi:YD repeat-containing protein